MKIKLSRLSEILMPREEVAGIAFSDSNVHLILFSADSRLISKSGVILPSGLIENGEIKDRPKLIKALEILKNQAGPKKLKINPYVIVSVPGQNVFSQILELPQLSPSQTEEAVRWNAQMTLPLEPAQMYYDWEELKTSKRGEMKKEIFLVLSARTKVNPYLEVLEEAGFIPLAFEMPALGLARLIQYFATDIDRNQGYLTVAIDWSGVEFMVIKNGMARFDFYRAWLPKEKERLASGEFKPEEMVDTLVLDAQKVINFHEMRSGEKVAGVILASYIGQKQELSKFFKIKTGLEVFDVRLRYFADLDDAWFPALGSALRGLIPREEDMIVSLMPLGTEEYYRKEKILAFVSFWGNIAAIVLLGLAGLFLIFDVFMTRIENNLGRQPVVQSGGGKELGELETRAREFNNLVAGILNADTASRLSRKWDHVFSELFKAAEASDVTIAHVSISSMQNPVAIQASAPSQDNASDFGRRLAAVPFFFEVSLPPSGFTYGVRVDFGAHFTINVAELNKLEDGR